MNRVLRGVALGLAMTGLSQAQELRVKFEVHPAEASIVLVGQGGLRDRELPHAGSIYTVPDNSRLRFSMDGYEPQIRNLDGKSLAEDQGVRLYPAVYLTARGYLRLANWLSEYSMALAAVGLGGMVLVTVGARTALASRKDRLRLSRIEQLSGTGDPMVGRRLDQYLLTQRLGSGGMATVYRGIPFDSLDESEAVALKIILEEKRDAEFFQRFKREVEVTKSLSHPNTLRLFGWGDQDGIFFLIMELVAGQPLRPPPGGFSVADFGSLLPSLMGGLLYAHGRGIVHRDLKPDNLMLMPNGQIKVMDFGLARAHDMTTVTASGTALGTPAYMAPEQIMGGAPNASSDQYSLGITLYEMLCGRRPFEYPELMAQLHAHLTEEPMPLRIYRPDISTELEQVVMRMLCKAPARRFANLEEVNRALLEAIPRPSTSGC